MCYPCNKELVFRAAADDSGGPLLLEATAMTAVTITLPPDVVEYIDELRGLELLSRASWLRREVVVAVRSERERANTSLRKVS
jgi:hypothetical protein